MQRLGTIRNLLQQRYNQLFGHTLRCFTFIPSTTHMCQSVNITISPRVFVTPN